MQCPEFVYELTNANGEKKLFMNKDNALSYIPQKFANKKMEIKPGIWNYGTSNIYYQLTLRRVEDFNGLAVIPKKF